MLATFTTFQQTLEQEDYKLFLYMFEQYQHRICTGQDTAALLRK